MRTSRSLLSLVICLLFGSTNAFAQSYRKPPQAVLDVLSAPVTPSASLSPKRDLLLLATGVRYPPISDLAQPMLRLAGLRINPNTMGPHRATYYVALALKSVGDGAEVKVALPAGAQISLPRWSPDGGRFAFMNTTPTGIELWTGDSATGQIKQLKNVRLNAVYGEPLQWLPDSRTLVVQLVPPARAPLAPASNVPREPVIQESVGRAGALPTYEDLLKTPYDEEQFEYYATAQLALVDAASGKTTKVGQPAIFEQIDPAPDGQLLLVARAHRPFSYLFPVDDFPKEVEVWDMKGQVVHKLASLPLADQVPIGGVPEGPRAYTWRPSAPATLVWVEALDKGDPKQKAPFRDRIWTLAAPFNAQPAELIKTEQRFAGMLWGERADLAFISDYDRDTRVRRTIMLHADTSTEQPRVIWQRNAQDRYGDPGTPVTRLMPNGQRGIIQSGDGIHLAGTGASPAGDRPFLDALNLKSMQTVRLFRSDNKSYETFVALLKDNGTQFITQRDTPTEPSNYFIRTTLAELQDMSAPPARAPGSIMQEPLYASVAKPLTNFPDPTPQLRGITKRLVTYKRKDGVQCSFTLYLPPDYKEGTRLPTVVWAYPLEFNDAATAGQVSGSAQRYTSIVGPSHLFFLLEGYAVLDNATMPVVGDPQTVNDTYIDQIVMSAQAAIDKAVELGVTDRERVGVGGHSYGAFMTANLLAHSDLFRAGIARSGAYNRTLTPFGFQSERRILWEAPDMYVKVSPFMYADKIKEPILLIHGEADNNQGTFPIQSERMYAAIRGTGGTVRLVILPLEAHGYAARESTEHVLYEMINWFDKYVKHAGPRTPEQKTAALP